VQCPGVEGNEAGVQKVRAPAPQSPVPSQISLNFGPWPCSCRYASLYFVACIDMNYNELITLEVIHMFVETLDRYFGNVCELDIM
jgi:hypothetical protein